MKHLTQELLQLLVAAKDLNRLENYRVVLIPLATQKEIGCSGKGCTEILKVASPDDEYIEIALEQPEGKSIEHEYQCVKQHTTKIYWFHPEISTHLGLITKS
jgi:hypothetical protein